MVLHSRVGDGEDALHLAGSVLIPLLYVAEELSLAICVRDSWHEAHGCGVFDTQPNRTSRVLALR